MNYKIKLPNNQSWTGGNLNIIPPIMRNKDGSAKYAFVTLLFPNPSTGELTYLDGNLSVAFGLKRQKSQADIVCMITKNVNEEGRSILRKIYDKLVVIDDLIPDQDLFRECQWYKEKGMNHPYTRVFQKLYMFDKTKFPYEKVCFIDSDIMPLCFYDTLFNIETPAAWIEVPKYGYGTVRWENDMWFNDFRNRNENPSICDELCFPDKYNRRTFQKWGDFVRRFRPNIKHGDKVPKKYTNLYTDIYSGEINAGLFIIKPDNDELKKIITEITSPLSTWFGLYKKHKGYFANGIHNGYIHSYCYPEQMYLTQRYSGKWHSIDWGFCGWGIEHETEFGIHFILYEQFKPWQKQSFYEKFTKSDIHYKRALKIYNKYNELFLWGMINYPEISSYTLKFLKLKKITSITQLLLIIKRKIDGNDISNNFTDYYNYTTIINNALIKYSELGITSINDPHLENKFNVYMKKKSSNSIYNIFNIQNSNKNIIINRNILFYISYILENSTNK